MEANTRQYSVQPLCPRLQGSDVCKGKLKVIASVELSRVNPRPAALAAGASAAEAPAAAPVPLLVTGGPARARTLGTMSSKPHSSTSFCTASSRLVTL